MTDIHTATGQSQARKVTVCLSSRYNILNISLNGTYNNSLAGTAVLSKHEPTSITKTRPGHPDAEAVRGRIVTLEFEKFYLVATYVTNAGQGLKVRLPFYQIKYEYR